MASKWTLQIHDEKNEWNSIIAIYEFDNFPSLRLKMVQNRGRTFLVRPPDCATAIETAGLLDLRSQGFNIKQF
jgi:hypothetical protein